MEKEGSGMSEHDKCVREMYRALTLAGVLTVIIFSFTHTIFAGAGEVIGFFAGTELVLTYAVWSAIDWIDKKRE